MIDYRGLLCVVTGVPTSGGVKGDGVVAYEKKEIRPGRYRAPEMRVVGAVAEHIAAARQEGALAIINRLANQRQELWRKSFGNMSGLSEADRALIGRLNDALVAVWGLRRIELAGRRRFV